MRSEKDLRPRELEALRRARRRLEEAERLSRSSELDARGELAVYAELEKAHEILAAVQSILEIGEEPASGGASSSAADEGDAS